MTGEPPSWEHLAEPPLLVGIEHEFELFSGRRKLDFRRLFAGASSPFASISFRDRSEAVALEEGYVLSCDEQEAELATAPVSPAREGCIDLALEARRCRRHLLGVLAEQGVDQVRGYSTHFSVTAPPGTADALVDHVTRTIAPALVLLLERPESPGVFVRPRRRRVELGSEYVEDERRIALASLLLCAITRSFLRDGDWSQWPYVELRRTEPEERRGGTYLPHDAFGDSIHARGAAAEIRLLPGATITVGELLARSAELAAAELGDMVGDTSAALLHEVAAGGQLAASAVVLPQRPRPPAAGLLASLVRDAEALGATPRFLDWEGAAFTLDVQGAEVVVGVPWDALPRFLLDLREGRAAALVTASAEPALANLDQLGRVGVFASVDAAALGAQADSDGGRKKRPPPKPSCSARLEGPECVCAGRDFEYTVTATCPGSCRDWDVDDADVAFIESVTGCTATVRVLKEGVFTVSAVFDAPTGPIHVMLEVHAYDVLHVLGGTDEVPVATAPLVQPHPVVRITAPAETGDAALARSAYKVHERKLDAGFGQLVNGDLTPSAYAAAHLELELPVKGTLADFFGEIDALAWSVNGAAEVDLDDPAEFNDSAFATAAPGESNMNARVIVLAGLGEFTVKLVATNAIDRRGSDWITVLVSLRDETRRRIATLQRSLADLRGRPRPSGLAGIGHAVAIAALELALAAAWRDALADPYVQVFENEQVARTDALRPVDQTRTQGRDGDEARDVDPATVTSEAPGGGADSHPTELRLKSGTHFLTRTPVTQFWVTKREYEGDRYTWDQHGLLLGDRGGALTSQFFCCRDTIPVFGVEVVGSDCFELDRGETATLEAEGLPVAAAGRPGEYRWSVVAKPKGAKASVEPAGWSTVAKAKLSVDASGLYTVRVDYRLGGRESALTYALRDLRVHLKPALHVEWDVARLGDYAGALATHLRRPYYQERTDAPTLAAEMLIRPKDAPVIGRSFSGVFSIPSEVEFGGELTLRAYYRPFSPSLGPADYEDFTGPPYVTVAPDAPGQAVVELRTRRDIHALHVLDIRYEKLERLKGQAVPIQFTFAAPPAFRCDPHAYGFPIEDVLTTETPATTATTTRSEVDLAPRVNLLLYGRDLGLARPSNGFQQISDAGDHHNLPTGNLFLQVPVLIARGHGECLSLDLVYNSAQASYQDSLELLQALNGVRPGDIRRYYCPNPVGKGWTHSYNIHLREYVRPRDARGRWLERYVEVVAPDGNRIQFAQDAAEAGGVRYRLVHRAEHWLGSSHLGHSLRLRGIPTANAMTYELQDRNGKRWRFDERGDLTEITDDLIEACRPAVKPLTVRRQGPDTIVTDSCGRTLTVPGLPEQPPPVRTELLVDPMGRATALGFTGGRLTSLRVAADQEWSFAYHDNLGEPAARDTGSFLKEMKDPRGVETLYEFYDGGEFHKVPVDVARDFWGALGRTFKGTPPEAREHLWRYQERDATAQRVVHRRPGGVEWILVYRRAELAVTEEAYVRQERDPVTLGLTGRPNYEQKLAQPSLDLPLGRFMTRTYRDGTKLVETATDLAGSVMRTEYEAADGGQVLLVKRVHAPDGVVVEYEHDARQRVWKAYNGRRQGAPLAGTPFAEHLYDARGCLIEKRWPDLGPARGGVISQHWTYDPATGRLTEYSDVRGALWTYGYDHPSRDRHRSGLATSQSVEKRKGVAQPQTLEWELSYDELGRVARVYDPVFGGVTERSYTRRGALEDVKRPPIPTALGGSYAETLHHVYDPLGVPLSVANGVSRQAWTVNDFGEATEHVDRAGYSVRKRFGAGGAPLWAEMPAGVRTGFVVDELNRTVRIDHPLPDARAGPLRSEAFADTFEYDDAAGLVTERRYAIDAVGERLQPGRLRRTIEKRSRAGRITNVVEWLPGGPRDEREMDYDTFGELRLLTIRENGTARREVVTERDAWGRTAATVEREGGGSSRSELISEPGGNPAEMLSPPIETITPGEVPRQRYSYDELGRVLDLTNSYGTVVKRFAYRDAGASGSPAAARLVEYGQDPADPSAAAGVGGLVVVRETELNRRGLETVVHLGPATSSVPRRIHGLDEAGRVVEETDENGVKRTHLLDGLGRPRMTTTERPVKRADVSWRRFRANDPGHVETRRSSVLHEYSFMGEPRLFEDWIGKEERTYDALGRVIQIRQKDGKREDVSYDAIGRVVRRRLASGTLCTFVYDDATRSIEGRFANRNGVIRTKTTLDWDGRLVDYRYLESLATLAGTFNRVAVHQEYGQLGKLRLKEYRDVASGARLASIGYGYNAAKLRTFTELTVNRPGLPPWRERETYGYDANMRLCRLDAGPPARFRFDYNAAGFVTKLARPSAIAGAWELANATTFERDSRGRLTRMVERAGLDTADRRLSELWLDYVPRQRQSWERDAPWEVAGKELLAGHAGAPRGVTYRRRFAENPQDNPLDVFVQDLAYGAAGGVDAAVTRWQTDSEQLVDVRGEDVTSDLTVRRSTRSHRDYEPGGTVFTTDFVAVERASFGSPSLVVRRSGVRPAGLPKQGPAGWIERSTYSEDKNLATRIRTTEDLRAPGADAVAQQIQQVRGYGHDALGRLAYAAEWSEVRNDTGMEPEENVDPTRSTLRIATLFQYGPDGEEVIRFSAGAGRQLTTLTVSDGPTRLVEVELDTGRLRRFVAVPGLGVRLCASTQDPQVLATPTSYYRFDHRGATLYTTDTSGRVLFDFRFGAADGARDLFGRVVGPGPPGVSEEKRDRLLELWSYFQASGPRFDSTLTHAHELEERGERVLAQGHHPSILSGGRNDYGFSPGFPHMFGPAEVPPGPAEEVVQGAIDFLRGVGDTVSLGATKYVRERGWGEERGGVVNPYAYLGGVAAGIAVSSVLTGGASAGTLKSAEQAGRLLTALRAYKVAAEVVPVMQATYAAANGHFTWVDLVGVAPAAMRGFSMLRNYEARNFLRGAAQEVEAGALSGALAGGPNALWSVSSLTVQRLMTSPSMRALRDALLRAEQQFHVRMVHLEATSPGISRQALGRQLGREIADVIIAETHARGLIQIPRLHTEVLVPVKPGMRWAGAPVRDTGGMARFRRADVLLDELRTIVELTIENAADISQASTRKATQIGDLWAFRKNLFVITPHPPFEYLKHGFGV